jgi:MFS family permease
VSSTAPVPPDAAPSSPAAGARDAGPPALGGPFTRLWTASTASAIGDGTSLTAAPLLASALTGDPRLIAGVTLALTLPFAVFGIPAGILVDRVDLRRAMARVDLFRGAVMLMLCTAVASGRAGLPALYACFFVIGTCETFFRNASQVLVPSVVPAERLVEANGRLLSAQNAAAQFVGPLAGSLLYSVSRAVPFALDCASFLTSAGLLTTLPVATPPPTRAGRPKLLRDMTTGAAWLLRHRLLRNLAVTAGAVNLVVTGMLAVLVVHAHVVLHLGATGYGLLLACQAVGAVFASRVAPRLTRWAGAGGSLVLVVAAIGVACVVIRLVPSAWAVGPALALIACAGVTWDVVVVVKRQTLIPLELQGRVNSVYRLLAWGAMPVGAALAGVLTKAAGTPAVFTAGSAVMALLTLRLLLGVRAGWLDGTRVRTP